MSIGARVSLLGLVRPKQNCDPMFVEPAESAVVEVRPKPPTGELPAAVLTSACMLDILEAALHAQRTEWLFFRELRIGAGHRHHDLQRLDAFALNCLPHRGMKRICYEVKTSRADFFCELKQPLKRRIGMRFSNEFYFVTPAGLVTVEQVPVDCGLVEIGTAATPESQLAIRRHDGFFYIDPQHGAYCMVTVPAAWRDTPGPTWQFAAAMLRNRERAMQEKPPAPPKQHKLDLE